MTRNHSRAALGVLIVSCVCFANVASFALSHGGSGPSKPVTATTAPTATGFNEQDFLQLYDFDERPQPEENATAPAVMQQVLKIMHGRAYVHQKNLIAGELPGFKLAPLHVQRVTNTVRSFHHIGEFVVVIFFGFCGFCALAAVGALVSACVNTRRGYRFVRTTFLVWVAA